MDDLGVFLMCLENRMQKFDDVAQFMEKMNQNKINKKVCNLKLFSCQIKQEVT